MYWNGVFSVIIDTIMKVYNADNNYEVFLKRDILNILNARTHRLMLSTK